MHRNDLMDLKQHVLSEYKENNLKIKKYFLQSIATEWNLYRQGKQDGYLRCLVSSEHSQYPEAPPCAASELKPLNVVVCKLAGAEFLAGEPWCFY